VRRAEYCASIHDLEQRSASLAGVEFYKANGFEEIGRGKALLMSDKSMPCMFMRKFLAAV
jgi:hypothetical protein